MTDVEQLQQRLLAVCDRLYRRALEDLEASAYPRRYDGPVVQTGSHASTTETIALRDRSGSPEHDATLRLFEQMADDLEDLERTLRRRDVARRFL